MEKWWTSDDDGTESLRRKNGLTTENQRRCDEDQLIFYWKLYGEMMIVILRSKLCDNVKIINMYRCLVHFVSLLKVLFLISLVFNLEIFRIIACYVTFAQN